MIIKPMQIRGFDKFISGGLGLGLSLLATSFVTSCLPPLLPLVSITRVFVNILNKRDQF